MLTPLKLAHTILPLFLGVVYIYFILLLVIAFSTLESIPSSQRWANFSFFHFMVHLCASHICSSSFQTKSYQELQRVQRSKHIENFLVQESGLKTKRAQTLNKIAKTPLSYRPPILIPRLLPATILLRQLLMHKTAKILPLPRL
jgi:hypothetical protein